MADSLEQIGRDYAIDYAIDFGRAAEALHEEVSRLDADMLALAENLANHREEDHMNDPTPRTAEEALTDEQERKAFYAAYDECERLTGHKPAAYDVWMLARGKMTTDGRATLSRTPPAPSPEPVAWRYRHKSVKGKWGVTDLPPVQPNDRFYEFVPMYAAPPLDEAPADPDVHPTERAGKSPEAADGAVHDAIMRALDEAGIYQSVLRGMCVEVGLERFRDSIERAGEAVQRPADGDRDYRALYEELLYAVGNKYPGESRHQTALRYIERAEQSSAASGNTATARSDEGEPS
jgi:hypothetical protein